VGVRALQIYGSVAFDAKHLRMTPEMWPARESAPTDLAREKAITQLGHPGSDSLAVYD
jgi:hypothetical protein